MALLRSAALGSAVAAVTYFSTSNITFGIVAGVGIGIASFVNDNDKDWEENKNIEDRFRYEEAFPNESKSNRRRGRRAR
jgi:hypothetical protein